MNGKNKKRSVKYSFFCRSGMVFKYERSGIEMIIRVNDPNCRINFKDMCVSKNPPTLSESLSHITPFDLSEDVINGNTKIHVDILENSVIWF